MSSTGGQPVLLIDALLNPALYPHTVDELQLIETHISWVILTGPYAYKIKKPVNLGFLDFSTLEKRKAYCEEELRLNQRTAPSIYLEVLPVCGSYAQPRWGDGSEIIEYAVKMLQFPQAAQLDRLLKRHELSRDHLAAFAHMVAGFHSQVAIADTNAVYGDAVHILQPVEENFFQIRERITETDILSLLDALETWTQDKYREIRSVLEQRKQQGFIRECHGDMHLRNLAWIDNKPIAFDCIEFNPNLRWIDVISEIAFLVMDLQDRQQPEFAQCFLNTYLEATGDYKGIKLLPFYLLYRALVRAKVDAIRLNQQGLTSEEGISIAHELSGYLNLAQSYTEKKATHLMITHGLSGSGKTTLTQSLVEKTASIRIRSDVERKRLAGLQASDSGHAAPGEGIYSRDFSIMTYHYLLELAACTIDAGYSVIVDATFLDKRQRDLFYQLALDKGVKFTILDFTASADTLRQRISQRNGDASDADLETLELQLSRVEPLADAEMPYVISIDTETVTEINPTIINQHDAIQA